MTKAELEAMIKDTVGTAVADVRKEMEEKGKESGVASHAVMAEILGGIKGQLQHVSPQKGRVAAQIVRALVGGKNDPAKAFEYAKRTYGADAEATKAFEKALSAGDAVGGGFLIREEYSSDFIELLRPMSAVRKLNPIIVPMDSGTLRMSGLAAGATGGYIGENNNIPKSEQSFRQLVASAKKLAVLTPVSNDLIRRNSAQADTVVRDDLVAGMATLSDVKFIRSPGSNGEPKGLKYWAKSTNKFNANATVNLANVTTDIGKAILKLMENNSRMLRPGWIFAPRTFMYLFTVRDGNGNFVFRDELRGGTFFSYPFAVTSQIPVNLGGGTDESEVYFADFADVVIAEATQILLDASETAAYHDGANVQAAFSLDQTVVRAIVEHDLVVRHEESIAVIEQVKWI